MNLIDVSIFQINEQGDSRKGTVLHKKVIFLIFIYLITLLPTSVKALDFKKLPKNIQEHLLDNNPYVKSEVDSKKNEQSLRFVASGLHNRECQQALKKIGHYENYQEIISFIAKSTYDKGRINLELSSAFLPFDMILNFKIPRIYDIGEYPFVFDNGFLLNLFGKVKVSPFKENKKYKCFISLSANWTGKKTQIPDYIFQMFTKTIGEIGISKLFRVSGHRY